MFCAFDFFDDVSSETIESNWNSKLARGTIIKNCLSNIVQQCNVSLVFRYCMWKIQWKCYFYIILVIQSDALTSFIFCEILEVSDNTLIK